MMASEAPLELIVHGRATARHPVCQIDIFLAVDHFLEAQTRVEPERAAVVVEVERLGAAHLHSLIGIATRRIGFEITDDASVIGCEGIGGRRELRGDPEGFFVAWWKVVSVWSLPSGHS